MNKNISTFIGCDSSFAESSVVIFGVPFDGTTSYRPGTRFASSSIRNESFGIETYSPYQHKDLTDFKIFDSGDLELPLGNTLKILDIIENHTQKIIDKDKIPCMIGGEHLVTLGSIRAVAKKYPDLHVLHFDAHADARDNYLGEKLSHATVIRRVWDILGDNRIFQFGIRSCSKEEFEWSKNHLYTSFFNLTGLDEVIQNLKGKPVYLSLDLDILDPSTFPGTGTPEAGGVTFKELLDAILKVLPLNIVGLDVNELSPVYDQSGVSTTVACKILRELILVIAKN